MITAIIQARMGSSRLPKKVLMKIGNHVMLKYMVDRVQKSKLIDKVVVATSLNKLDDEIENFCLSNKINCFRGSENDVLDRYYMAAKEYNSTTIVRLTADCPLIDSKIIDKTIKLFNDKKVDYAANAVPPDVKKYPDGSDVEVFSFDNLELAWKNVKNLKDREHVTFYFWKYSNGFSSALLNNTHDWGNYRITVDYLEDFQLVSHVITYLDKNKLDGSLEEIINFLNDNPKIKNINSQYTWGMNW
jgi:spore coat polysaccharide biosynthesis protein SpsF